MAESLHEFRFPGESEEYRRARDRLLEAEIELRRLTERVAEQRRTLPPGGAVTTDYVFQEWDAEANASRDVPLSALFEDGKDTLYLYSFMIVPAAQGLPFVGPCPSCTSIIDGIDGAIPHITQRVNFAVAAKPPIEVFAEHGARRGWRHARLLSSSRNSYNRDYGSEDADGNQWPLATVFQSRADGIYQCWSSELWFVAHDQGQGPRHVDYMWPLWFVLDRTPDGRGSDWEPRLAYD
jgi:predicted dithiol-disulfide oxidoreductase (DUF899 family)